MLSGAREIMAGVYAIVNLERLIPYIGSTINPFYVRWGLHKSNLRNNRHGNEHLQRAWNKYDEEAFRFEILEETGPDESIVRAREQVWLDLFRDQGEVYNIVLAVEHPMLGRRHTEEAKQLIREARECKPYPALYNKETGTIIPPSTNRAKLCRERGWAKSDLVNLINGKQGRLGSWILEENKDCYKDSRFYPALYNMDTGEIIPEGVNGSQLCRERGWNHCNLSRLINGKQKTMGRWILEENRDVVFRDPRAQPYPAFYNKKTGEVIPAGINRSKLCQERGWNTGSLWYLISGRIHRMENWVLEENNPWNEKPRPISFDGATFTECQQLRLWQDKLGGV